MVSRKVSSSVFLIRLGEPRRLLVPPSNKIFGGEFACSYVHPSYVLVFVFFYVIV